MAARDQHLRSETSIRRRFLALALLPILVVITCRLLGPKDLDKGSVCCVKRMNRQKSFVPMAEVRERVPALLEEIQAELFETACRRRDEATSSVDDYDDFKGKLDEPGGFLLAHWCGDEKCEGQVQAETKATIRCIALDQPEEAGRCLICGGDSRRRAHFARAY